jgi:hypothetical protein
VGRIFALIIAVALLVAAGLFYFSPSIALSDIRSACRSNDIEALAKLIDFDSVRASLKTQLDAGPGGVGAPPKDALNDPVGATGDALKSIGNSIGNAVNNLVNPNAPKPSSIVPPDPNAFLAPQALLALTYGYGKESLKATPEDLAARPPSAQIAFFSLDRTRLTVTDPDRGTTTFTFERRGLTKWVLVHIGLPTPDGGTGNGASSSNPAG